MIDFDKFIIDEMDATKEEIEPLYRIYISEMKDMITQLRDAAENDDSEAYKRLLHNVKGINANMRIDLLLDPITNMYQALMNGETLDLDNSIEAISVTFDKVNKEIKEYFGDTI
jgi:HPt (histidine-containing phosphotransfer) domain-containing protein